MPTTRLRLKLLDFGAPQYIVAAIAGMAPSRLSEYALGRKKMPIRHIIALSKALECNPEDIVGEEDDPIPTLDVPYRGRNPHKRGYVPR